jgi:hypothetical protein
MASMLVVCVRAVAVALDGCIWMKTCGSKWIASSRSWRRVRPRWQAATTTQQQRQHRLPIPTELLSLLHRRKSRAPCSSSEAAFFIRACPMRPAEWSEEQRRRNREQLETQHKLTNTRCVGVTLLQLLHHLSCRPLGASKLRTLPLFLDGCWHHFLLLRLRHMTLVVSASMQSTLGLSRLSNLLLEWEDEFSSSSLTSSSVSSSVSSALPLPMEEPPVLLRHYTGHDTIAFMYHHTATGVTVAPPPRNTQAPGAMAASAAAASAANSNTSAAAASKISAEHINQQEVTKTLQVFSWFYARAKSVDANHRTARCALRVRDLRLSLLSSPSLLVSFSQLLTKSYVSEVILHLKGYRFYGVHEDDFSLFILYDTHTLARLR